MVHVMSEVKFKREERYIVVKIKNLAGLQIAPLRNFLRENRVPTLDCVVVESDWPEYEKVWRSIERRMTGQPAEDFDAQRLRADTAEAELTKMTADRDSLKGIASAYIASDGEKDLRIAAAEQRISELVGKTAKCKECGSDALFWFAHNQSTNGIQHNRMNTHDITCVMVLGCAECSATIRTVSADKIAERMTAALNPKPEAGSHE